MKSLLNNFMLLVVFMCFCSLSIAQENKNEKEWWKTGAWRRPVENPLAKKLPLIKVSGNRFINEKGDTILFRGLSISDPDKVEYQGHWTKNHFERVKETGADLIRIPVHPVAWRNRTAEGYLKLLDEAVQWCTELGMYVIIDWHSIGNLEMELFQDPMYNTSKTETYAFWRTIAAHFRGNNTVAFYEIFNEPTDYRGMLGSISWSEWKAINQKIIKLIRSFDKQTIPLVAGFDWAYDLNYLHYDPIEAEGVAYVSHPYPMKRQKPWEDKWDENFGFAAVTYPIIATEIGFWTRPGEVIDADHYANRIVNYLESRNISWVAWVFDPEWDPSMITSWDTYELTECGKFFKQAMQKK